MSLQLAKLLTVSTGTKCCVGMRKDKDETNQRRISFFFSSTFRPFVKAHPSITYHVLEVKFSTMLFRVFMFVVCCHCLRQGSYQAMVKEEQKNCHKLTSKRLINNTRSEMMHKCNGSEMKAVGRHLLIWLPLHESLTKKLT